MKTPFLNKLVIFLIIGIRPLFGPAQCRYVVTCTKYATFALESNPLCSALWLIIKRVCACNPLW